MHCQIRSGRNPLAASSSRARAQILASNYFRNASLGDGEGLEAWPTLRVLRERDQSFQLERAALAVWVLTWQSLK